MSTTQPAHTSRERTWRRGAGGPTAPEALRGPRPGCGVGRGGPTGSGSSVLPVAALRRPRSPSSTARDPPPPRPGDPGSARRRRPARPPSPRPPLGFAVGKAPSQAVSTSLLLSRRENQSCPSRGPTCTDPQRGRGACTPHLPRSRCSEQRAAFPRPLRGAARRRGSPQRPVRARAREHPAPSRALPEGDSHLKRTGAATCGRRRAGGHYSLWAGPRRDLAGKNARARAGKRSPSG